MKILMVLTSHDQLGDTGHKTGFWLEEFAAPYYALKDAGAQIVIASPKGGQPPLDPKSDAEDAQSDDTRRFKADAEAQGALANTQKLAEVKAGDFDAVFYPGGHGPLWLNQLAVVLAPLWANHVIGEVGRNDGGGTDQQHPQHLQAAMAGALGSIHRPSGLGQGMHRQTQGVL